MLKQRKQQYFPSTFTFTEDVREQLVSLSQKQRQSASEIIRNLITREFERNKTEHEGKVA
jgi:predicted CopG family antitoxin